MLQYRLRALVILVTASAVAFGLIRWLLFQQDGAAVVFLGSCIAAYIAINFALAYVIVYAKGAFQWLVQGIQHGQTARR